MKEEIPNEMWVYDIKTCLVIKLHVKSHQKYLKTQAVDDLKCPTVLLITQTLATFMHYTHCLYYYCIAT